MDPPSVSRGLGGGPQRARRTSLPPRRHLTVWGMATARYAEPPDGPAMGVVHVRAWQAAYRQQMPQHYLDGLHASDRGERWTRSLQRGRGAGECVSEEGTTTALVVEE